MPLDMVYLTVMCTSILRTLTAGKQALKVYSQDISSNKFGC